MNCIRVEEYTADYLGNELNAERREDFEAHLASCDRCRARLGALQETLAQLNRLRAVPLATAAEKTGELRVVRRPSSIHRMIASSLRAAAILAFGVVIGRATGVRQSETALSDPSPGTAVEAVKRSPTRGAAAEPVWIVTGQPAIHPRWIALGRKVKPGRSSFASQLLVLAQSAHGRGLPTRSNHGPH